MGTSVFGSAFFFAFGVTLLFLNALHFWRMKEINLYDGIKLLRNCSKQNFPVSFSFISCNRSKGTSKGLVSVEKGLLRTGMSKKQSKHANNLIAYENLETGEKKQFWLPLLMTINGLKITHDRFRK